MMPYTDYTVRLGDLKRAIMKNPYDPNLNIDGYMRYLKYNTPSAQPEPHYCRECKWSRCHINVDKHGKSETYWRCQNWDGGTDEEGYCHEWERRNDGQTD